MAFGVGADALLRVTPWGLNVFLVTIGGLAAALAVSRASNAELSGEGRYLAIASLFFAAALVWRDSPTLTTANTCALLTATTLAALTARAGQLRRAGVTQYAVGLVYVLAFSLVGLTPTLRQVNWRTLGSGRRAAIGVSTVRGLALAFPALTIFAALFAAADANFEHLLTETLRFNLDDLIIRLTLMAIYAWLISGTIREMLLAPDRPRTWTEPSPRLSIGTIELTIVLGLLDLLFLTFVALQLPYLFGGRVQVSALGYSDYARRGFFELLWVVGLMLPILLLLHWLLPRDKHHTQRIYRVLATGMVGLLFVIVASAVQRMQIYVADAGLTELRVQASAMMLWLSIVLVWFLATVLREQRARFAFGALISAFVVIATLDVVNPDEQIVRTNAVHGHLLDSGRLDQRPLASLSADATPAIVDALPLLPTTERMAVIQRLQHKLGNASDDWRSFNWSRSRAEAALAQVQ
ncbi:MAG TPA: DUF4173 domain-containing protein [Chloroflexota bacterium]